MDPEALFTEIGKGNASLKSRVPQKLLEEGGLHGTSDEQGRVRFFFNQVFEVIEFISTQGSKKAGFFT
jgi:hypothetical protein